MPRRPSMKTAPAAEHEQADPLAEDVLDLHPTASQAADYIA